MIKLKSVWVVLFLMGMGMGMSTSAQAWLLCKSSDQNLNAVYDGWYTWTFSTQDGKILGEFINFHATHKTLKTVPLQTVSEYNKKINPWYKPKKLVLIAKVLIVNNKITLTLQNTEHLDIPGVNDGALRCKFKSN